MQRRLKRSAAFHRHLLDVDIPAAASGLLGPRAIVANQDPCRTATLAMTAISIPTKPGRKSRMTGNAGMISPQQSKSNTGVRLCQKVPGNSTHTLKSPAPGFSLWFAIRMNLSKMGNRFGDPGVIANVEMSAGCNAGAGNAGIC